MQNQLREFMAKFTNNRVG